MRSQAAAVRKNVSATSKLFKAHIESSILLLRTLQNEADILLQMADHSFCDGAHMNIWVVDWYT